MKRLLMDDANNLYWCPSMYEEVASKIASADYDTRCLNETQFNNLVFMGTNSTVWPGRHKLVNKPRSMVDKLTPKDKPCTLRSVVDRIMAEYPYDHPIKIFKHMSEDEPWFDGCFIMGARFDYRLLGELKIRPLDMEEKRDSPDGSFYLEDGNHRALVYAVFLRLGTIIKYKPVRAIVSEDWEHIFPWITMPSHQLR